MADRINFSKKINDSVQAGDELYYSTISGGVASDAVEAGPLDLVTGDPTTSTITIIGEKHVIVDALISGLVSSSTFFMFRKPVEENVSSLKGYYAEATFTNSSTEKQELFAVGSEVTMSSK